MRLHNDTSENHNEWYKLDGPVYLHRTAFERKYTDCGVCLSLSYQTFILFFVFALTIITSSPSYPHLTALF